MKKILVRLAFVPDRQMAFVGTRKIGRGSDAKYCKYREFALANGFAPPTAVSPTAVRAPEVTVYSRGLRSQRRTSASVNSKGFEGAFSITKSFLLLLGCIASPAVAIEPRMSEGLIVLPAPVPPETGTMPMGDNCDYQQPWPGV